MATYWNGKGGSITISAVSLPVTEWEISKKNSPAEVTNANSPTAYVGAKSAAAEFIPGPKDEYDFTATAVWDSANKPEAVGVQEGSTGTFTFAMGSSSLSYSMNVVVAELKPKVNVREGAITYTFSGKGTGVITNA